LVIDEDKDSDMKISDQRDKRGSNLNLNTPISNYKNSKGRALYKQHSCYDNTISKSPNDLLNANNSPIENQNSPQFMNLQMYRNSSHHVNRFKDSIKRKPERKLSQCDENLTPI